MSKIMDNRAIRITIAGILLGTMIGSSIFFISHIATALASNGDGVVLPPEAFTPTPMITDSIKDDEVIINDKENLIIAPQQIEDIDYADDEILEINTAEEENIEPEYQTYIVRAGDCLWNIAYKFYGDGSKYPQIMAANGMTPNSSLNIGMELKIYDSEIEVVNPTAAIAAMAYMDLSNPRNYTGEVDTSGMRYAGNYRITGYDPNCAHCCSTTHGITSSGRLAELNYSVGCNGLPAGTKLYIQGYGFYRVDDTGNGGTDFIDIACDTHELCYTVTNYNIPVYIIEE